jgi:hypothetical protein
MSPKTEERWLWGAIVVSVIVLMLVIKELMQNG